MSVSNALGLAFAAHEGQFRKYGDGVPYIQHPVRVSLMTAAALLHDVLEDTEVPAEVIAQKCGPGVLEIVQELTNPAHLPEHRYKPRAVRKQIDRDHLKTVSREAKIIKLCDRIDNLRDVVNAPADFRSLYAAESSLLLEALVGTDPDLERQLAEAAKI